MALPEQYLSNMKALLKEDFEAYLQSFQEGRFFGIRANSLKVSPAALASLFPEEVLTSIPWCGDGFYYQEGFRPAKSPYYRCGLYYIQEPSAMSSASVLPVEPGDRVLDLCAAPGGKSTHLGARLNGSGVLVCNDISATRCRALLKNIELAGIRNACITNETPQRLAEKFQGYFNKILIDAPCSGEGMFRKDEDAVKAWEAYKGEKCSRMQREILYYADKMLAPGGMLLYSTCTFNPMEDELQIQDFLDKHQDYSLQAINPMQYGISKGLEYITENGQDLSACARIWPHKQKGEGHFIALLKKDGDAVSDHFGQESSYSSHKHTTTIEGIEYFNEFCKDTLQMELPKNLICHSKSIMAVDPELPNLKGLRIVRSGWYLGDIKTKRFEPSQSFAMGLYSEEVKKSIHFSLSDPLLNRYLKGESFDVAGPDGWNLVCLEDYPLGWAKVKDGRMKNKYLKSWIEH